ncbi:universal stress protein [Pseudonocardia sp. GCM10023141]|uniref:universal stress protein n=1 Tax=Pseudonocardia sp. GCM10023141 TaxID=3252653 RepID=UPI00362431FF
MQESQRIVVGIDGSAESKGVLRFALEDAVRRHARLAVVRAFRTPTASEVDAWGTAVPTLAEMTARIEGATRELVQGVIAERDGVLSGVSFDVAAVPGRAGPVLVDAARGAAMLIVGHRDRAAVTSVLLGSVGLHCVLHAPCAVTVVRRGGVGEAVAEEAGAQVPAPQPV